MLNRSGVRVLHDFTSAPEPLQTQMTPDMQAFVQGLGNPARGKEALAGNGNGFNAAAAVAAWTAAQEGAYYEPMNGLRAAEAMEIIAQRLAGVPGRKNLVWVSTGFSRIQGASVGRVNDAFDHAARAL